MEGQEIEEEEEEMEGQEIEEEEMEGQEIEEEELVLVEVVW